MSHFYVLVLVPSEDEWFVETKVEELLSPYDENLEVDEYDARCWCAGKKAKGDIQKILDAEFGTHDEQRTRFYERHSEFMTDGMPADCDGDTAEELWETEVSIPRETRRIELFEAHPEKNTTDAKCSVCNGSGTYRTRYNPKSTWDWYSIGGRWNDEIADNKQPVSKLLALDEKTFNETAVPYAVVTPDKEWHERGHMGWFGMSSGDMKKDEWQKVVRSLFEQNKDCLAVVVDCHI